METNLSESSVWRRGMWIGVPVWMSLLTGCLPPAKDAGSVVDESGSSSSNDGSSATTEISASDTTQGPGSASMSTTQDDSGTDTGSEVDPASCAAPEVRDSYLRFVELAAESGGDYWFTARSATYTDSQPELCVYETFIEVYAGEVVSRDFNVVQENEVPCEPEFYEPMGEVGTHESSYALPPFTLVELYANCCSLLMLDGVEPTFRVDDQGIATECRAQEPDCEAVGPCWVDNNGFGGFDLTDMQFGVF